MIKKNLSRHKKKKNIKTEIICIMLTKNNKKREINTLFCLQPTKRANDVGRIFINIHKDKQAYGTHQQS